MCCSLLVSWVEGQRNDKRYDGSVVYLASLVRELHVLKGFRVQVSGYRLMCIEFCQFLNCCQPASDIKLSAETNGRYPNPPM